jgi:hypothetical protein
VESENVTFDNSRNFVACEKENQRKDETEVHQTLNTITAQ